MKKLLGISFLLAILSFAAPVYAEGDMPAGTRTCTQNCSGLYEAPTPTNSDERDHEGSMIVEIYSWIYEQITGFID